MRNISIVSSRFFVLSFAFLILSSCSTQYKIGKEAESHIFSNKNLKSAHIGISIFDAHKNRYLYNHQGDKYFIPASNTKLFTCYAAMKFLGDSIVGAKYLVHDDGVFLQATGDPTFLHPDFTNQPLYNFLRQPQVEKVQLSTPFSAEPLGRGWAWDDYMESYMAERDPFPMYGNIATITYQGDTISTVPSSIRNTIAGTIDNTPWKLSRTLGGHFYIVSPDASTVQNKRTITMAMEKGSFASRYLSDTIHKPVERIEAIEAETFSDELKDFYSQPTDSLLKIMMHRSDNFFAEQTLLMVSNKVIGQMNDYKITDTLVKTIYKNLPQKPKWVDGSGLSRYNLSTPQDFVWILHSMKDEFGFGRVKEILPTGGEGTLNNFYKNYAGRIFAKTGTLSNHVALSGILLTKKNQALVFSVLVNAHQANAVDVRRAVEKFVSSLIEKY